VVALLLLVGLLDPPAAGAFAASPVLVSARAAGDRIEATFTVPAGQQFFILVAARKPDLDPKSGELIGGYQACGRTTASACTSVRLDPGTWYVQAITYLDHDIYGNDPASWGCTPPAGDRFSVHGTSRCASNVLAVTLGGPPPTTPRTTTTQRTATTTTTTSTPPGSPGTLALASVGVDAAHRLTATWKTTGGVRVQWLEWAPAPATLEPWSCTGSSVPVHLKSSGNGESQDIPSGTTSLRTGSPLLPGTYFVQVVGIGNAAPPSGCVARKYFSTVRSVEVPATPVPIESVANGCGGGAAGNDPRYLDEVTFASGTSGLRFKVRFRLACNVHDAGYSGAIVRNPLHGNAVVDYRTVSRKVVDDQFRADLKLLCDQQLPKDRIPAKVRTSCYQHADGYWRAVRAFGRAFYDANLAKQGTQLTGPRG
jgi:hypothetical protein